MLDGLATTDYNVTMSRNKPDAHLEAKRDFPTSVRMSRRAKSILRKLALKRGMCRSAVIEQLILEAA